MLLGCMSLDLDAGPGFLARQEGSEAGTTVVVSFPRGRSNLDPRSQLRVEIQTELTSHPNQGQKVPRS